MPFWDKKPNTEYISTDNMGRLRNLKDAVILDSFT